MDLKRPFPPTETSLWRAGFLTALRWIKPSFTDDRPSGLELGNAKLGKHGRYYNSVFVWNLPAVVTCPGASQWCLSHCYTADSRSDIFPISSWAANWGYVLREKGLLAEQILSQVSQAPQPAAVRIHSSGDFFDDAYIQFWIEIASRAPGVHFWAYTRSWTRKDLLPSLELLRSRDNVELFASWDYSMPTPPSTWRIAYVVPSESELGKLPQFVAAQALFCPEQENKLPNCASCAFCIQRSTQHVIFTLH